MNHPVVVITGAASGIGLALAAECVSQGLAVMMVDRRNTNATGQSIACRGQRNRSCRSL